MLTCARAFMRNTNDINNLVRNMARNTRNMRNTLKNKALRDITHPFFPKGI